MSMIKEDEEEMNIDDLSNLFFCNIFF